MAIYIEKKEKLNLNVSNPDNDVKITVDCYIGTVAEVAVDTGRIITIGCGETKTIGIASALKGITLAFDGDADNPDNNQIKISHKIFEVDGNEINYTFPDDYTGNPPYDNADKNPSYTFFVNFK